MPVKRSHLLLLLVAVFLQGLVGAFARQTSSHKSRGVHSSGAAAQANKPKFKAIFEPVNYGQDATFFSVYCADQKNCWAAGGATEMKGGFIVHTSDGGTKWMLSQGDPESADRAFRDLEFVNAKLGFAVQRTGQASNLFRTEDGEHWLPVGKIAEHTVGYHFTSATSGVAAGGNTIEFTQDAGQSWKPVAACASTVTVQGLARNVNCTFRAMSFPSATTGYVTANSSETKDNIFLARTSDGGATWKVLPIDVPDNGEGPRDLCFVDDNTGFMRVGYGDSGRIYETSDGGKTWTAVAAAAGDSMRFAGDKRAAWAFHYSRMGFSSDGGERWSSRQIQFPATPRDSALPFANFGLVVGDHGMIYRYRIVPEEYVSQGMISAPMLGSAPQP